MQPPASMSESEKAVITGLHKCRVNALLSKSMTEDTAVLATADAKTRNDCSPVHATLASIDLVNIAHPASSTARIIITKL
jgi:hypothetical protein